MLEPDPENLAGARKLFALNGNPTNIEIVTAGLWNQPANYAFKPDSGAKARS